MAHDWPDVPELTKTVREFLEGLAPRLQGIERFHAMCSIYLLEIVERELPEWEPRETADDTRLRALAGTGAEIPRATLVTHLSAQIRSGEFDQRMDELLTELTAHVVAKVRISKPASLDAEHHPLSPRQPPRKAPK